jgi:carbon monoxide dehydrogenase subunit G
MKLENSFDVPAPPATAWELLSDLPRVVPCMPGAELTEVVGENEWKAKVSVKLGPIALQFGADIVRDQIDEAALSVRLKTRARELRGRGGATATIVASLTETGDGGTHVVLVTDVSLQGAVAQYGRGVIATVANQMIKSFAECIEKELAHSPAAAGTGGGGGEGEGPADGPRHHAEPIDGVKVAFGALWHMLAGRFHHSR